MRFPFTDPDLKGNGRTGNDYCFVFPATDGSDLRVNKSYDTNTPCNTPIHVPTHATVAPDSDRSRCLQKTDCTLPDRLYLRPVDREVLDNGDKPIMPINNENACIRRKDASLCFLSGNGSGRGTILALAVILALTQSACLFWGKKEAVMPSAPVRVAFLPFNTPEGAEDFRWASMAMPVMMAKISEKAEGMEPAPLWETMQYAIESTGSSRTIDQESAAYVANWLNSKWSAMGTLSRDGKDKITLLVDFISPRDDEIAYRYTKKIKMDAVDINVRKAFREFLNYVSAKPMDQKGEIKASLASLRQLAEVLDREYGWTVPAEPGKAQEIVSNLAQSDLRLARHLFNPATYPILEDK